VDRAVARLRPGWWRARAAFALLISPGQKFAWPVTRIRDAVSFGAAGRDPVPQLVDGRHSESAVKRAAVGNPADSTRSTNTRDNWPRIHRMACPALDKAVAESESYGRLLVERLHAMQTCRRVGHRRAELYAGEWDKVRSYFRQSYPRSRAMEVNA